MTTLDARFTSPGQALSEQASLEKKLERALSDASQEMLLEIKKQALARNLTPANSAQLWKQAVEKAVGDVLAVGYFAPERDLIVTALTRDDLGSEAHFSAMAVMKKAAETYPAPSKAEIEKELDFALSLDTPTLTAAGRHRADPVKGARWLGQAWRNRVTRTVRTGFTGFTGFVAQNAFTLAKRSTKTWVSHHDDQTRPTHDAADGQTVAISDSFTVGGELLMYPGDQSGTADEIINCRCVMVSSR
jgi:hypothetical protein